MCAKNQEPSDVLQRQLILSCFPGIDLLGRAFSEAGFCVVQGPDLITGGDIRDFRAPLGRFDGIIGGPPCQDFSKLNRTPGDYGGEMLREFGRVISEASPDWYLFENVVGAPHFEVEGYRSQRFALDLAWFSDFSRRRDFVFGHKGGKALNPMVSTRGDVEGTCITSSDQRSFRACCDIQGLPADFDLPGFTLSGKKKAVANGVPLQIGAYVANLIALEVYGVWQSPDVGGALAGGERRCLCGCGRRPLGRARYASASCRQRAKRARDVVPSGN